MSTIKITVTAPEAPPAGYKGNPEGVQNFLAEVALKAIRGMGFMVNMSGKTEEMAFRTIGQLAMDYRVEIEVKPFVKPEDLSALKHEVVEIKGSLLATEALLAEWKARAEKAENELHDEHERKVLAAEGT